jgi:hypothetical protein
MYDLPFSEIVFIDFEYRAAPGERPVVHCMVAVELRSRRVHRLWFYDGPIPTRPPFPIGPDVLLVAFFLTAEFSCFRVLRWLLSAHAIDLYSEFKREICGLEGEPNKPSLVYALDKFGLESLDVVEKTDMRDLAIRGGPFTGQERKDLLNYCESDTRALPRLLNALMPRLDLRRAVLRGEFCKALSVEHNGTPIDTATLAMLDEHWGSLQLETVRAVDANYGLYDGTTFKTDRFARWLHERDIPWPRTPTGGLTIRNDVFEEMARTLPILRPLQQARQVLAVLRFADIPVGHDARNRCLMSQFGTITGRCAPSTSDFIFARPVWMRSLIQPPPGRSLAYLDWQSQEYAIGAVLSGDGEMVADYEAGDPYLAFAKKIGLVPQDATKTSHRTEREIVKSLVLGTQYGMGEKSLALKIGKSSTHARELLDAHRSTYRKFWAWTDAAVDFALFHGYLWTRFGWQTHVRYRKSKDDENDDPNIRSLRNFPCQGNAADMLRLAAGFIVDAGVQLDATIHDAVLIEADSDKIDAAIETTRRAMDRASRLVLHGFVLRTDVEIIHHPQRYRDDRECAFFDDLMSRLQARLRPRNRSRRSRSKKP